ncbi:MAG TPA: Gfo/Idh/MocA family oxidoreductase [Candidatus Hydrogenedentes bacterium]|nr:Gfo/Idh/MocA family oxidoreductase [Candidatus Hydrogenedentota bacterium]
MERRKAKGLTRRRFLTGMGVAAQTFLMMPARANGANARIRVGVIGCGRMGMEHVRMLRESRMGEKADVTAVCDLLPLRRHHARGEFRIRAFRDWRDLISSGKVDAVVVATPDDWHVNMSVAAMMLHGLDVYCETPMALTHQEAQDMARASRDTKRVLQIGARPVASWQWRVVRALVDKGAIGRPRWCQLVPWAPWTSGVMDTEELTPRQWADFYVNKSIMPNGREFLHWQNYGKHSMGLAAAQHYESLAGVLPVVKSEYPVRVSAAGGRMGENEGDTPDVLMASLEYASGLRVELFSPSAKVRRFSWIRGEQATLVVQHDRVGVEKKGASPREIFQDSSENTSLLEDWLESIHTGRDCACGPELGHKVQVAISMAVQAFQEGKTFSYDPDNAVISSCPPRV